MRDTTELRQQLKRLEALGALQLRAEWANVYERPAPRRISRDLLLRGIAYRLQEQMYGGLKPATIKKLKQIAATLKDGRSAATASAPTLKPGVRLLREWNGHTHIVEVVPEGFAWQGKTYRSLTKVARLITGLSWSGPVFFGLRDKRPKPIVSASQFNERLK